MTGGEQNYVHFGYETTFKTAATANKIFGENVQIRNVDLRNNIRRLFNLGGRSAVDLVPGRVEGALSIDFNLSEPWFMKGVLGELSTSGSGPYYHTFTEANVPPSLTIENGVPGVSGSVRRYLGAIIGDCKISQAVGDEPAKVSLTIVYADELYTSSTTTQIKSSAGIYPFSMGHMEYPTGTEIANTESVELGITNNAALKWGLGGRKATRYDMRARTYDVTTTNFFDDAETYLHKAYGQTSSPHSLTVSGEAGVKIHLDNEAATTEKREWSFIFTNATIERHSLGTQSVEQEQMETIEIIPQNVIIQAVNNTATMP